MTFRKVSFVCKDCGNREVLTIKEYQPVPVFCNRKCQKSYNAKHKLAPISYVCLNCGEIFKRQYAPTKPPIFCKTSCRTEFSRKAIVEKYCGMHIYHTEKALVTL